MAAGLLDPCVLYPAYLRLLGAQVGVGSYITPMELRAGVDLIRIGDRHAP
jgi:hypothetical protein